MINFIFFVLVSSLSNSATVPSMQQGILKPKKADLPPPLREGEMEILITKQTIDSDGAQYEIKNEGVCHLLFKVNVYDLQNKPVTPDTTTRGTCTTKLISRDGMDSLEAKISVGGMIYLEEGGVKSFSPWYSVTVANHSPWAATNIVSVTEPALKDIQFVLDNQPEQFYKDARIAGTVVMRDRQ